MSSDDTTTNDSPEFEGFAQAQDAIDTLGSPFSRLRESVGGSVEDSACSGSVGTGDVSLVWDDLADVSALDDLPSPPCTRSRGPVPEIGPLPEQPLEYKK